jgi:hypothetical protein
MLGWIQWNCEKYLALNACHPAWQSQQWKMFIIYLVGEYKNGFRQLFLMKFQFIRLGNMAVLHFQYCAV